MGSLACAILVLNNLRDLEKDKSAGKITLAVKIGDSQTRRFYQGLIFTPLLIALALVPTSFYFLLAFLALPQILKVAASVRTGASGSALIELLERTGKIQIIYSLAISLASLLYAR
jgi:1,4-dihydroxy-2-naphthoate octaprenyltransferase